MNYDTNNDMNLKVKHTDSGEPIVFWNHCLKIVKYGKLTGLDWIGLSGGYWCRHYSKDCSQAQTFSF